MNLLSEWTGKAAQLMHIHKISMKELAAEIGWHEMYLSVVLEGQREPKGAEASVLSALDRIIAGRRHE